MQALAQGEALLAAVDHFSRLSRRQRDAEWFDALSAAHSLTAEYREARKRATFSHPLPALTDHPAPVSGLCDCVRRSGCRCCV